MKKSYNKLFLNKVRAAVDDHNLIAQNDRILVGLSGGKDSIFLLYCLILLKERSYLKFDLIACHIDIGLGLDMGDVEDFCRTHKVDFIYKNLDIKEKIFSGDKSPCYICSSYKRGAMARIAKDQGAKKIAYGHHLTDLCDTFFLNIVKENKFRTFKAKSYNENHQLSLIRPLIYIREEIIIKLVGDEKLPLGKGDLCPYDDKNERQKINQIISYSSDLYEDFQENILKSIQKADLV